jgi:hypothetical protein
MVRGPIYEGIRWPGHEADHLPPISVKTNKA